MTEKQLKSIRSPLIIAEYRIGRYLQREWKRWNSKARNRDALNAMQRYQDAVIKLMDELEVDEKEE